MTKLPALPRKRSIRIDRVHAFKQLHAIFLREPDCSAIDAARRIECSQSINTVRQWAMAARSMMVADGQAPRLSRLPSESNQ